ncbi:MAG: SspB family protein [Alphaproteobacteria bacterium]
MAKDLMNYPAMMDAALRSVVRQSLERAAERGLPGAHHFYISFRTDDPGVTMPEYLREKYPEEITIVLQHQFWGLEIEPERFSVTLSFRDIHERLVVPFAALTGFADPSVSFGLQFEARKDAASGAKPGEATPPKAVALPLPVPAAPEPDAAEKQPPARTGEVVALDAFRKK